MNKQEIKQILDGQLMQVNDSNLNAMVDAITKNDINYVIQHKDELNKDLQEIALAYAITNDKLDIVKYMVDNNSKLLEDHKLKELALLYYVSEENIDALNFVLDRGIKLCKEEMYEVLLIACEKNSEDLVKVLLSYIGDVNFSDLLIETNSLIYVEDDMEKEITEKNHIDLIPEDQRREMMERVESFFGPIERPNSKLITQKYIELFDMLLNNGVRTSIKGRYGKTPLQQVINTKNGKLITKILDHHAYTRYNKKMALGYDLRDLNIAEEDLNCVLKSAWYKEVKAQRESIKEDIKLIVNCENYLEMQERVLYVANKRQLDEIKDRINNNDNIDDVAKSIKTILKKKLNNTNELLDSVERFKDRLKLNTKIKVLEVVDICKKNNIKSINEPSI